MCPKIVDIGFYADVVTTIEDFAALYLIHWHHAPKLEAAMLSPASIKAIILFWEGIIEKHREKSIH